MKQIILALFFISFGLKAQYLPTPENLQKREEFRNDQFGLFIHWGVYSVLGSGEWVMQQRPLTAKQYENLPNYFNPKDFNADTWVQLAKAAGMKYITVTTRHHDGFSMFDTKYSDWDIMDKTSFKRDVIKELADACKKEGIKLFFYYSHLDWYRTDYYPRGSRGQYSGRPNEGNWNEYLQFMNNQLTELLTKYGDVGGIWFDGWWDKPNADWKLDKQYALIHKLQPTCLIGNNHHLPVKNGEDYQMFEQDLPGQNKTGFAAESKVGSLPLEMCETMYGALHSRDQTSWGYKIDSKSFKSTKDLVGLLVKAAGNNSNFLLNVGPTPAGVIQPELADTLKKIGIWMAKYGETVRGTRGGEVPQHVWGVSTQKDNKLFVHVLDYSDDQLWIPLTKKSVKKVRHFDTQKELSFQKMKGGILVTLPAKTEGSLDRILVLE